MITKEEFLTNTTEEEVFSLLHEFKERAEHENLINGIDRPIIDADLIKLSSLIIRDCKNASYLTKK